MWVLLITDNLKDIKGKSKALCLYCILKYDQAIPTALIPISSFTPEKPHSFSQLASAAGQAALFIGLKSPFT